MRKVFGVTALVAAMVAALALAGCANGNFVAGEPANPSGAIDAKSASYAHVRDIPGISDPEAWVDVEASDKLLEFMNTGPISKYIQNRDHLELAIEQSGVKEIFVRETSALPLSAILCSHSSADEKFEFKNVTMVNASASRVLYASRLSFDGVSR